MSIVDELNELHRISEHSSDPDTSAMTSVKFTDVTAEEIATTEARVGGLPPSYKRFVMEHGVFSIGAYDHVGFRLVPLAEVRTLLEQLEWELEVRGAPEVAESLSLELETVEHAAHGLIFAMDGHEDFWVFDKRSRDEQGECKVVMALFDDLELEYFGKTTDRSKDPRFEDFLFKVVRERISKASE